MNLKILWILSLYYFSNLSFQLNLVDINFLCVILALFSIMRFDAVKIVSIVPSPPNSFKIYLCF
ncbi:hypothetical protein ABOONEI_1400 [Aciduliprofundum boonei T469]|nr:hypothetical protein ABOONEI_1400 [Aciduliprofundum boonei T469]